MRSTDSIAVPNRPVWEEGPEVEDEEGGGIAENVLSSCLRRFELRKSPPDIEAIEEFRRWPGVESGSVVLDEAIGCDGGEEAVFAVR